MNTANNSSQVNAQPTRKARLKFSLRSLLVALTVVVLFIGYTVNRFYKVERQVNLVQSLGGHAVSSIYCTSEGEQQPFVEKSSFQKILDYCSYPFSEIVVVDLSGCRDLSDRDLKTLVEFLPNTKSLSVVDTQISDDGIQFISKLKSLRYVDLSNTRVTVHGIEQLRNGLPDVEISEDNEIREFWNELPSGN